MQPIEELRSWMSEFAWNQADLARELGITEQSVSGWFRGLSRPGLPAAIAIERITHGRVKADAWLTDDERRVAFGEPEVE